MSLVQYTISNNSSVGKTFSYFSASLSYNIIIDGFSSSSFTGDESPLPTLVITGSMVSEDQFTSDSYIPPQGEAWLWNNGDKVQYIKVSNTPLTGSNISSVINRAEWIDFSMVEAVDKNGNFLYPTSPNTARLERYIIDNALDRGNYNTVVVNSSSPKSSKAVFANNLDVNTGFSYIDQQFNIDQDCNPILNNATEPRSNEWLQDVDYSVDANTPINLEQIINNTATRASTPQSNYTQLGFINSRYEGSSTTRSQINKYDPQSRIDIENRIVYDKEKLPLESIKKGKGPSLGKIPNVELNNSYIAYFNKILDPYPILNNKVAYYVKYLIDSNGNIYNPNLSDVNYSLLSGTFQLNDYDKLPTRVNVGISNIDESKELSQLNEGFASVFKIGEYPFPILYTQTSSIGYSNSIPLSGSNFFTELGIDKDITNFGVSINAIQNDALPALSPTTTSSLNINELEWVPSNLVPISSSVTIPTSSLYPNYVLLFPLDTNGDPPDTPGSNLSDNYRVNGSFTFSTSTIPSEYSGKDSRNNYLDFFDERQIYRNNSNKVIKVDLIPYRKPPNTVDNINNYVVNPSGFKINNVKLIIISNPGGVNENINIPLQIEELPRGYGRQWEITSNGFVLTPDSLYIEDLIIQKLLLSNDVRKVSNRRAALPLIAGGWANSGANTIGFGNVPVKYDWVIEFEFNELKQGTGLFLKANGSILLPQNGGKHGLFNQRPDDILTYYGAGGSAENNLQWKRTFTPTYSTGINSKPILVYRVISPLSERNAIQNQAIAPFWRRYNNSSNELFMSSSILNQTYGLSFIQAKLPYIGDKSTDFPLTIEPGFIEFDPVSDIWKLEKGDEIRFENKENLTYTIINIINDGEEDSKRINSTLPEDKLRIIISPSLPNEPINFDFFVIRRYKKNKNFIILNQQMPYGFSYGKGTIDYSGEDISAGVEPVTRASSPGVLLPEYRIDEFNKNPDLVLKDLIEKNII
jgi:hypothetical protein